MKASLQEYRDAQKLKRKKDGRLFEAASASSVANTSRRESEAHSSRERRDHVEGSLEEWKRRGIGNTLQGVSKRRKTEAGRTKNTAGGWSGRTEMEGCKGAI